MQRIEGPASLSLRDQGPFILPFLSDRYERSGAFSFEPFEIPAGRCSGSPVILTDRLFAGFLRDSGGTFIYDGEGNLTIEIPSGQVVSLEESGDPAPAWSAYNKEILEGIGSAGHSPFLHLPEYSPWVEQKQFGEFGDAMRVNNVPFIRDYAERVLAMGLPPGKLVIEAGWCFPHGGGGFGDWEEDVCQFPDFPVLIEFLQEKGFVPGLWLAPPLISPSSRVIYDFPGIASGETRWQAEGIEDSRFRWAASGKVLKAHFKSVFKRFLEIGIRKFKLDLFCGPKRRMREILRCAYEAIADQEPAVEVDCHIPDIFASPYCHVVRCSDTFQETEADFDLCRRRWWVCRKSSPHKPLYLDPVGGNGEEITEKVYRQYLAVYRKEEGFPAISLLPDRFGEEAVRQTRELLEMRFP